MILLDKPRATLTGFHRYQGGGYSKMDEQWRVNSYHTYLESIGRLREVTNGYASHWSNLAHAAQWRVDNDDLQARLNTPKSKKVSFQAWVKKNYPEIIKEYKEVHP